MNKLLKSTFYVVAAALTSTASLVGYNEHQQSQFAAANPLFAENLESLADPSGSNSPHYGPALEVIHREESLSDSIIWEKVNTLSPSEYQAFCKCDSVGPCLAPTDVPERYRQYLHFGEKNKYWCGKRLECVLNGYFYDAENIAYTSLASNGKPEVGIYYTKGEFISATF